jgi:hypothetical protein
VKNECFDGPVDKIAGDCRDRDCMVVGFYNYLCNQCLSPLMLWVRTLLRRAVLDTTLCDQVGQWLAASGWFSPGTPVSSTNKTDRLDITEILLKVELNTITLTQKPRYPSHMRRFPDSYQKALVTYLRDKIFRRKSYQRLSLLTWETRSSEDNVIETAIDSVSSNFLWLYPGFSMPTN